MASTPMASSPVRAPIKVDSIFAKLAVHDVPPRYVLGAAFCGYLILALAWLHGNVPAYLAFAMALAPWVPIIFFEISWTYKHFGWLAAFSVMTFVQIIHYTEHTIQVIQVHFYGMAPGASLAIFSAFNVEWVHFAGDATLSIGTLVLLWKFPRNPLLWIALPFQLWHVSEHAFLFWENNFEGVHPNPFNSTSAGSGLFGSPHGLIGGGFGLSRPDLHFIYNTLYTIPFALALIRQLRLTYDKALEETFPLASHHELQVASRKLETLRYVAGETIVAPGDDADRMYIVTEGIVSVLDRDMNGNEVEVATLHHGQYFGATGLLVPNAEHQNIIRAKSDVMLLEMDEATFKHLIEVSHQAVAPAAVVRPAAVPAPVG